MTKHNSQHDSNIGITSDNDGTGGIGIISSNDGGGSTGGISNSGAGSDGSMGGKNGTSNKSGTLIMEKVNKYYLAGWVGFHAAIFLAFLVMLAVRGSVSMDADLFNMLPKPNMEKAFAVADERLTEKTGLSLFVMASHEDFDKAKEALETAYSKLQGSTRFKTLSLYSSPEMMAEVTDFVQKYRWNLLDDKTAQRLTEADGAEEFAQNALAKAYSAFTFSSLDNLETDPFMLGDYSLQKYILSLQNSGTAMSPKDGVLASFFEGKWYVMMTGTLSKSGSALASKTNGVAQIYDVCGPLEKDGVRFVYSGTPFHSYKSSSEAMKEVSVISAVTLLSVVLLMLSVFRSPLPIVVSVGSIVLSMLTAFAVTFAVFGKMHVLTMVFGTSLIGSCIDYSLHFFVNWRANRALKSGGEVRSRLLRALVMSLVSTELCYLVLAFAPFTLLKQMSVFSLCGIASSFFTVAGVYPMIKMPKGERRITLFEKIRLPSIKNHKKTGITVTIAFFVLTLGTLVLCRSNIRIKNNIHRLYQPKGRVSEDSILCYKVTQYDPHGWFIITGDTMEETLQREESVTTRLSEVNMGKEKGGYIATTQYIPSIARQRRSYEAAINLLPLALYQAESLGLDSSVSDYVMEDYEASDGKYITPEGNVPSALRSAVDTTWLGEIDGRYYSIVLPVSITDEASYDAIAESMDGVYFEDKVRDIGRDLDRLTRMILMLFIIAYIIIVAVIRTFYDWGHTIKIASIPALIVLVITSLFAALGIDLEFFTIVGMILVFGLGLDYVIYMIENEKRKDGAAIEAQSTAPDGGQGEESSNLEPFAIALSFVTTAVSFGALALSSFVPVHMLGLSIFLGLSTAFLCTML